MSYTERNLTDWERANDYMEGEYGFSSDEFDKFMDITLDESDEDGIKYAITKGFEL